MDDLKLIKDKYGEKMMHFCRSSFPTILESPGLLYSLLKDHFGVNRFLYEDIVKEEAEDKFRNYINSLLQKDEATMASEKSPKELFEELGYDFYECKTEEEIQHFKKYYKTEEELCTFSGGRLKSCYVFFAVKKDAENIKRLAMPKRQDDYGTSVISIQFTKGDKNALSIKNRYNHTVSNPDATFSNNLENIKPGLTDSFEKTYNLNIHQNDSRIFDLNGYVYANDGKYYKYNYEINNIYYCSNNIIIDNYNVIKKYEEKEKYLIFDYFILDLVNKKIIEYDDLFDPFVDSIGEIKKIDIIKDKHTQNKIIKIENIDSNIAYIEVDKTNRIVSYANNYVEAIGTSFLEYNKILENLEMNNVKIIGNRFCYQNRNIKIISLNNVEKIGNNFFPFERTLTSIKLPSVRKIGDNFLFNNVCLNLLYMPKLEKVGDNFLNNNDDLEYLNLPNLIEVAKKFLYSSKKLKEVYLPNLQLVENCFMYCNNALVKLDLPNLIKVDGSFLYLNNTLLYLNCPSLKSVNYYFLHSNKSLVEFNAPNLENVDISILAQNYELRNKILRQITIKEQEKVKTLQK